MLGLVTMVCRLPDVFPRHFQVVHEFIAYGGPQMGVLVALLWFFIHSIGVFVVVRIQLCCK